MDAFQAKLVAATAGSTLTALTMTPFDLVKTRLQTQAPDSRPLLSRSSPVVCCQPTNAASCVRNMSSFARPLASTEVVCLWEHGVFKTERVNGAFDALRHVWRAEGVRGLWKGVGTTLVIGVPSATTYILLYDYLLHSVLPPIIASPTFAPLAAGILARSAVTTVVSPLELIRTSLQSTPLSPGNPHTLRSVLASFRIVIQDNGFRSLWRGLGTTLWRDVPFSGWYWASYETLKRAFGRRGYEGANIAFISGAISGTSAALITSPFDVLKTRRQALTMVNSTNVTKTIPLLLRVIKTEGTSALFAGIGPRVAKIAPACGIMISCFEGFGKFLTKPSS
ncbi:hypothetical protein D9619_003204 [Psilocybe cf. subviscida]|uniref:Mitochondrial carrier n=1 Tax=Psilocybe cf. subviscida TaxID=2480587 RepID=A0A8H5AX78_9AGAR|nr:hypothetical protein D9619_003204 [Psilocybe cf. subviscida]